MPTSVDPFATLGAGLNSPGMTLTPITPNDTTDLATVTRAVHVAGAGGTVKVNDEFGNTATLYIGLGGLLPVRVTRIFTTGTTATGIVSVT